MPIYIYEHPTTGETVEIFQGINDEHVYSQDGVKWNRIITAPNVSADSINPNSPQDFIDKTKNKNYTLGDLWDKSKELSEARAKKHGGADPIKEKAKNEYKKKTKKDHPLA